MGTPEIISVIKDVATIIALLVAGLFALFVFFQLAPVLQLRILPSWTDDTKQILLIWFQVENKSRVRVYSPKGRIQILEHEVKPGASLSQWVPFDKDAILPGEEPTKWSEPIRIFTSTKEIFPGEVISLERLYHCPQDAMVLHIGLQVELELGFWGRLVNRKREAWRQTTTCFVVK